MYGTSNDDNNNMRTWLACRMMMAYYTTPTMPLYYTTRDIAWMMYDK